MKIRQGGTAWLPLPVESYSMFHNSYSAEYTEFIIENKLLGYMLPPTIEKQLNKILQLMLALSLAYLAFLSERMQNQPSSRTPTVLNTGEGLKILTKLRKEGNPLLVQADFKHIQKAKEAIEKAKQVLEKGNIISCSDWLITAKGELEKAKDKSLQEYRFLLGEEIKGVRLALAVLRKK